MTTELTPAGGVMLSLQNLNKATNKSSMGSQSLTKSYTEWNRESCPSGQSVYLILAKNPTCNLPNLSQIWAHTSGYRHHFSCPLQYYTAPVDRLLSLKPVVDGPTFGDSVPGRENNLTLCRLDG